MTRTLLFAAIGLTIPFATFAQDVSAERRAEFVDIMSRYDCRFHNLTPPAALIDEITKAGFGRGEVREVAQDLLARGDAKVEGEVMVALVGPCAE